MPKDYDYRHPEIDRECRQQEAITRYRCLKNFKKSDLSLDDQLFVENFEAAMHYIWGFGSGETTTSCVAIPVSFRPNKAS